MTKDCSRGEITPVCTQVEQQKHRNANAKVQRMWEEEKSMGCTEEGGRENSRGLNSFFIY